MNEDRQKFTRADRGRDEALDRNPPKWKKVMVVAGLGGIGLAAMWSQEPILLLCYAFLYPCLAVWWWRFSSQRAAEHLKSKDSLDQERPANNQSAATDRGKPLTLVLLVLLVLAGYLLVIDRRDRSKRKMVSQILESDPQRFGNVMISGSVGRRFFLIGSVRSSSDLDSLCATLKSNGVRGVGINIKVE